jgi:PAS domain S-box-containing protein
VASEESYRGLFEENPQPMWVSHRETQRFLEVNQAALRLYGYRREEFLERSLPEVIQGEPLLDAAARDRVSRGRHIAKDGSPLDLQLAWHPCRFEEQPAYLVVLHQDDESLPQPPNSALEHQVAECGARLQTAQRELETFSYSISHDLKAPLRHIDGFSRALLDDYATVLDPQAKEYLTRITQAAGKMSKLIDAIQQLSRVARVDLERQQVNLSTYAQVLSIELKHHNPQRKVEFDIEEDVRADADPRLARQLMEILIGNSWKFTSKTDGAKIQFGKGEINGEVAYFVRDNGAGFDMAFAEKLFSIFHRLHRAEEFEGSGVGLAIAQRIVGRHGGRIWAESAPGHGATFFFTL